MRAAERSKASLASAVAFEVGNDKEPEPSRGSGGSEEGDGAGEELEGRGEWADARDVGEALAAGESERSHPGHPLSMPTATPIAQALVNGLKKGVLLGAGAACAPAVFPTVTWLILHRSAV